MTCKKSDALGSDSLELTLAHSHPLMNHPLKTKLSANKLYQITPSTHPNHPFLINGHTLMSSTITDCFLPMNNQVTADHCYSVPWHSSAFYTGTVSDDGLPSGQGTFHFTGLTQLVSKIFSVEHETRCNWTHWIESVGVAMSVDVIKQASKAFTKLYMQEQKTVVKKDATQSDKPTTEDSKSTQEQFSPFQLNGNTCSNQPMHINENRYSHRPSIEYTVSGLFGNNSSNYRLIRNDELYVIQFAKPFRGIQRLSIKGHLLNPQVLLPITSVNASGYCRGFGFPLPLHQASPMITEPFLDVPLEQQQPQKDEQAQQQV